MQTKPLHFMVCNASLIWYAKLFNIIVIEINKVFIVLKVNIIRSLKYSVWGNTNIM